MARVRASAWVWAKATAKALPQLAARRKLPEPERGSRPSGPASAAFKHCRAAGTMRPL